MNLYRVSSASMQGICFSEYVQGLKVIGGRNQMNQCQDSKLICSSTQMNQFEELHESGRDSNLICAGTQIIWYMVSKLLINMCRISNDSV